jgi:hypothetical protein
VYLGRMGWVLMRFSGSTTSITTLGEADIVRARSLFPTEENTRQGTGFLTGSPAAACAALFPASTSEDTASAVRRRVRCAPRRGLAEATPAAAGALSPPDLAATGARNLAAVKDAAAIVLSLLGGPARVVLLLLPDARNGMDREREAGERRRRIKGRAADGRRERGRVRETRSLNA